MEDTQRHRVLVGRHTLAKMRAGRQVAILQLAEGPKHRSWVIGDELEALGDSPRMELPVPRPHTRGWTKSSQLRITDVQERRFADITDAEIRKLGARDRTQLTSRWNNQRGDTRFNAHKNPLVVVLTFAIDEPSETRQWRDSER